jgi:hypothetical protein
MTLQEILKEIELASPHSPIEFSKYIKCLELTEWRDLKDRLKRLDKGL